MPRRSSADKILVHAAEMFAAEGFAGTIMDDLAKLAGVNKATIYYHFKDKETLYKEVLARHFVAMIDAINAAVEAQTDVIERLKAYIQTFALESSKRSTLTSILLREIAGGGVKLPNRAKAQMHRVLMLVKSILNQGLQEGLFVKINVLTIHFMVVGSLSFYICSEPMRKIMVSTDADVQNSFQNSTIEEVSDEIFTMVKNALLNNPKES